MAFCGKCGAQVQDDVAFCPKCGNKVLDNIVIQDESTKKNNKLIGVIAIALVAVIAVVGMFFAVCAMTSESYEDVAINYAKAYYMYDYDGMKKRLPYDLDEYGDTLTAAECEEKNMSLSDINELLEEFGTSVDDRDSLFEFMCDKFASESSYEKCTAYITEIRELENYEISKSIREENEDKDEIAEDLDLPLEKFIDVDKISAGYEIEVEVCLENEMNARTITDTYTIVKYRGKWKVLTLWIPDWV